MAGSFEHCINENGCYRGTDLLENMGDMKEAVEQMVFMLLFIQSCHIDINRVSDGYFKCLRGEKPWPDFMKPGRT